MSHIPVASAIGSIMYDMISTQLDIAFALSVERRYQSNPGLLHWKAVKDIFKYLRKTKNLFLVYKSGELKLEGFTDSNFESDVDDSKSTSGFVFKLNDGDVSWKSSKQDIVANSTSEIEYIATSIVVNKGVQMRDFIQELGVNPQTVYPISVNYDNTDVVAQTKELRFHQ
ncbi:secreted RxLR effector protein 161-like [Primulina eburnea]|uniref:secreted RxLR effector protein 161-like n=1 Tax=Primulina eburnea TaxID=1245227 RepID=UPI003C6C3C6A